MVPANVLFCSLRSPSGCTFVTWLFICHADTLLFFDPSNFWSVEEHTNHVIHIDPLPLQFMQSAFAFAIRSWLWSSSRWLLICDTFVQIGSYFGSVLQTVDVDGDSYTDLLLVGAPMYMGAERDEQGLVYVYKLSQVHKDDYCCVLCIFIEGTWPPHRYIITVFFFSFCTSAASFSTSSLWSRSTSPAALPTQPAALIKTNPVVPGLVRPLQPCQISTLTGSMTWRLVRLLRTTTEGPSTFIMEIRRHWKRNLYRWVQYQCHSLNCYQLNICNCLFKLAEISGIFRLVYFPLRRLSRRHELLRFRVMSVQAKKRS